MHKFAVIAIATARPTMILVASRFNDRAISGAMCMGLYDSRQQAEDEMNEQAASWRRDNDRRPIFTRWVYRGT